MPTSGSNGMNHRHSGAKELRLDYVGEYVEMDLLGVTKVRAQVDVDIGDPSSCVLGFFATCSPPKSYGRFVEYDSTKRFSPATAGAVSAECDMTGFRRMQLRVITASAAADVRATEHIYGYSPLVTGSGGGVSSTGSDNPGLGG